MIHVTSLTPPPPVSSFDFDTGTDGKLHPVKKPRSPGDRDGQFVWLPRVFLTRWQSGCSWLFRAVLLSTSQHGAIKLLARPQIHQPLISYICKVYKALLFIVLLVSSAVIPPILSVGSVVFLSASRQMLRSWLDETAAASLRILLNSLIVLPFEALWPGCLQRC
jgi:hypothetical protein